MFKKTKQFMMKIRALPCFYCFLLLVLLAIYTQVDSYRYKKSIKIAVGKEDGAYYVYAKEYAKELEAYGIDLEIIATLGAKEAQSKVALGKVDFAFVQGGVEELNKGILALANVAHEPIWVLTRRTDNIISFDHLKHKKINICNPMSGTNPIAVKLLDELLGKNNYKPREENVNKAFKDLKVGKIDAMFYVIARSSLSLQKKIKDADIRIMHFENAESIRKYFIMNDMDERENLYYKTVVLKKYSLHPLQKLPAQDKTLLVKRTLLVTKEASDKMVRLFLKIARKVHSREAFFHDENYFINSRGLKYEQHSASKRYFEEPQYRYERSSLVSWFREGKKGFWLAQTLQKIEDAILVFIVPLGLMAFFIEVIYPISKIYTRREVNRWYRRINKMDTNIDSFTLEELEKRCKQLKTLLVEVQNTDDIEAVHLESYYAVHQQIREMIENFELRIKKKRDLNLR
jgi:TRAP-type uncharacterized transport system substrate-binding protein